MNTTAARAALTKNAEALLGALAYRPAIARRYVAAALFFVVATVAWTLPHVVHLSTTVLGPGGDSLTTIRNFWALDAQGENPFLATRDAYLAAPGGLDYPRAIAIGNGLFTGSIWVLGHLLGWVVAYNLYNLAGFVLAGFAAFLLLDRLRLGLLAASFGAYVFAFNPNHFEKAFGHAGLTATWIFPLLLLALVALHRQRSTRRAIVAGALVAAAFYLHSYLGLFALWMTGLFCIVDLVQSRARGVFATLRSYYTVAATWTVLILPAAVGWWIDRATVRSFEQSRVEFGGGTASAQLYLLPSARHPLLGGPMSTWLERHLSWEFSMFFGYTTMLLAAAGVAIAAVKWRRKRLPDESRLLVSFASLLLVTSLWASLPPTVGVGGVGVPTLGYFLNPLTHLYRVYSRFGVLVGFALVLLAAYALSQLSRRRALLVGPVVLVAAAFELSVGLPKEITPYERLRVPVTVLDLAGVGQMPLPIIGIDRAPPYLAWLRKHPGGIVADYPGGSTPPPEWAGKDVFYQYFHRHPVWQLAPAGTYASYVRGAAADLDHPRTPHILASSGVKYVVVHRERYASLTGSIPEMRCGFAQLTTFAETGSPIYAVTATPAERFVMLGSGFYPRVPPTWQRWPENVYWQWMGESGTVVIRAARAESVFLVGAAVSLHGSRRLDIFDARARHAASWEILRFTTFFRIPLEVVPGWNRFRFRASPGPVQREPDDPRLVSIAFSPLDVRPIVSAGDRAQQGC